MLSIYADVNYDSDGWFKGMLAAINVQEFNIHICNNGDVINLIVKCLNVVLDFDKYCRKKTPSAATK